jgi:hypothetical protein
MMKKIIANIKTSIAIFKMDLQNNYLYVRFIKWTMKKRGFVPVIAIVNGITKYKMFLGIPWVLRHDAKIHGLRIVKNPESIHESYTTPISHSHLD